MKTKTVKFNKTSMFNQHFNKNIKLELKDTKEENGLILGIYAKK